MKQKIEEAIGLRKSGQQQAALEILLPLLTAAPTDPDLNYQIAWTYDSMGKESDAISFYETALKNGLKEDREGAFLGMGSTYRCLGKYERSLQTFDRALAEFQEVRSFKVFRALTLYNLGRYEESVNNLLVQLLDTTNDPAIKGYEKALRFYSDKLNETWK
jgi:tetratricopeptide (TPR) repeat protein